MVLCAQKAAEWFLRAGTPGGLGGSHRHFSLIRQPPVQPQDRQPHHRRQRQQLRPATGQHHHQQQPSSRVRVDWGSDAGPGFVIFLISELLKPDRDQYSRGRCTVGPSRAER